MAYLLETKNLTKRFGGLTAVDHVSLGVEAGEVLALLGDNGAGKSTLIKMISGVYQPDEGEIFLSGKRINIQSPIEALANGIETIYQDLALAENLNVYANIFLGREKTKKILGFLEVLDHEYMFNESEKVLERLDIEIPSLSATIRTLSGGQRQAVAISRSMYWDAKVLIMDEPTAALGIAEQRKVLSLVKSLKSQGIGIIIISHQMHDVFEVADRIVVMRRGIKAGERLVKDVNPDDVVSLIMLQAVLTIIFVGHSVEQAQSENGWRELSVEGLTVFDNFNAWKRALWKQIVDLNSNEELKRAIHSQTSISLNENLISLLMRLGSQTGAEWMIIKNGGSPYSKLLILRENNLSYIEDGSSIRHLILHRNRTCKSGR